MDLKGRGGDAALALLGFHGSLLAPAAHFGSVFGSKAVILPLFEVIQLFLTLGHGSSVLSDYGNENESLSGFC